MNLLTSFVAESNRIEGINRDPTNAELRAHEDFLALPGITVEALETFVRICAHARLRDRAGLDVMVGGHFPPSGGPEIGHLLALMLHDLEKMTPYSLHCEYETLHPFTDGNGRSGRALWAWHRKQRGRDALLLGFLHSFYYEALEHAQDG